MTQSEVKVGAAGGVLTVLTSAQALVESGCLGRLRFAVPRGQQLCNESSCNDHDRNGRDEVPLHISNAVNLSYVLAAEFIRRHNGGDGKCEPAWASLGLDGILVRLRLSLNIEEKNESKGGGPIINTDEVVEITSVDHLNAITSEIGHGIIAGLDIVHSSGNEGSSGSALQALGRLLHSIFCPYESKSLDSSESSQEPDCANTSRTPKTRRRTKSSMFERLLELDYPVSICRLLNDLINRGNGATQHPISSLDEAHDDLKQMAHAPQVFLLNPENEFFTSALQFGQKYCGRSKELAKLLEVTAVSDGRKACLEAIFVSGIAGSGKTLLLSEVGRHLSASGCIVLKAKFNRGFEHKSADIVSNLFDDMLGKLDSEVSYRSQVARAITNTLDADSLSSLVGFVPNIQLLVPKVKRGNSSCSHWQRIFLLSKLLGSVLSVGPKIFIVVDDIQWSDKIGLDTLEEILASVHSNPDALQNLVAFAGTYREPITRDVENFTASLRSTEGNDVVHVTEIKLSAFSVDDITSLAENEMRLPMRLVRDLSAVVHKKTYGHPLFVTHLLNGLVADGTIAYSPRNYRFDWDHDTVCSHKTQDSVANLILSNLTALPTETIKCLRVVSCFGIQVQMALLEILEESQLAPEDGFQSHLRSLDDFGIIEVVGPMVVFTHDLIQEQVYESVSDKHRRQLHLDIGVCLGSKACLDSSSKNTTNQSINAAIEQLYLSDASDFEDKIIDVTSLISIATSQINRTGPEFLDDAAQRTRFAHWNVLAGKDSSERSNFRASSYFYKCGIRFLGDQVWLGDFYDLSLKLYEGVTFSSYAVGDFGQTLTYANEVISRVPLQDSLVAQHLLIGSLTASAHYQEAVARGLAVLRQLKFHIPGSPSPALVMQVLEETEKEASMHNFSPIVDNERIDAKTRNIMKLNESIATACYVQASPFLPLVACATVRYSIQNGYCLESASALVIFSYFYMFAKQSFDRARHWGHVSQSFLEKSSEGVVVMPRCLLHGFVLFWFVSLQETIDRLNEIYQQGLKRGSNEPAQIALYLRFKFSFFRGERLSGLSDSIGKHLQSMYRFMAGCAKFSALDKDMVDTLIGNRSENPYATLGAVHIVNKDTLLADAKATQALHIVEAVYLKDFTVSFWMGDYVEAEKASTKAMSLPSAKMPKIQLVYHMFYRGIVVFHLYRDGKGEKWLDEGKEILQQVETWAEHSSDIFENKLILLQAEFYASNFNVVAAKESFELSIKVARDNGYIHETGLAYECLGDYLESIIEVEEAGRCFIHAHECYLQWGARAKADKIWKDHNLKSENAISSFVNGKHKLDNIPSKSIQ